jgi:hypothetical protein
MNSQMLRGVCVFAALIMATITVAGDHHGVTDDSPPFSLASKNDPSSRKPPTEPPAVLYALVEGSAYVEGCFGNGEAGDPPACLCPLTLASSFEGPFSLTPALSEDPDFDVFTVAGVAWTVGMGDESFTITGDGEFRIGSVEGVPLQEMTLDLNFDGARTIAFHSGLVPVPEGVEFPVISVAVNMNDYQCYDTELTIVAEPGD